jgi:hypothetical protein
MMWGLHRHADALAINRAAQTAAPGTADADELRCWEASLLCYSGHPDDALRLLAGLDRLDSPRIRALYAVAEVASLVSTGKGETGLRRAREAYVEHSALREQMAIADRAARDPQITRCRSAAAARVWLATAARSEATHAAAGG